MERKRSEFLLNLNSGKRGMLTATLIFLLISLLACCNNPGKTIRKHYEHELYIDYSFVSYQGKNKTQSVYFNIDSVTNIWYSGKLIVNNTDTFRLNGFAKGNHYVVTTCATTSNVEIKSQLEIWNTGNAFLIPDSIIIEDGIEQNKIITEKTILYRKTK